MVRSSHSVAAISINGFTAVDRPTTVARTIVASDIAIFKVKNFEEVMHPRKYFTLNFIINELFSAE